MRSALKTVQKPNKTAKNTNSQLNNEVFLIYEMLNDEIDEMTLKVQSLINKNSNEFISAYQTHAKKVKKQLQILRKRVDEYQKQITKNDRAIFLEKQMIMFREDSLQLYQKLQSKTQQYEHFKSKTVQLERTNSILSQQFKQALKNKRAAEVKLVTAQMKIQKLEKLIQQKNQTINKLQQKTKEVKYSHSATMKMDKKIKDSKFSSLTKPTSYRNKNIFSTRDHQLKQWFLQCVFSIKKQIAFRKRDSNSLNFNNITSIQQFKMVDKLKLLEKFIQNQKLLVWMYQKIFPLRNNEVKQYLTQRNLQTEPNMQKNYISQSADENYKSLALQNSLFSKNNSDLKFNYEKKGPLTPKSSRNVYFRNRISVNEGRLNLSFL